MGEQGGRFASLMATPAFREQIAGIKGGIDKGADGDQLGRFQMEDPMQEFRKTWVDLKNVLADIGTVVMPPLLVGLKGFDAALQGVHAAFQAMFDLVGKWTKDGNGIASGKPSARNTPETPLPLGRAYGGARRQDMADVTWDEATSGGMATAITIWAQQALTLGEIKSAIEGPELTTLRSLDTTATAILSAIGGGIDKSSTDGRIGEIASNIKASLGDSGIGGRMAIGRDGVMTSAVDAVASSGAQGGTVNMAAALIGADAHQAARALGKKMTPGEWCADFVGGILSHAGIKPSGSSAAASYKRWGQRVASLAGIRKGDILVENHHVGIATGLRDAMGRIGMVSGNHGHHVGASWELPRKILDVRRASEVTPDETAAQIGGAKPGGGIHHHHGNVVVHGAGDPEMIARQVMNRIDARTRNANHDIYIDV
ncbi:hypothetical protein [Lichenifustis flavocetrariae]|uniref:Uncharacterized protein n=1 Tax=Lichenifustis flavocetrariae TaxID=2949735 RepID=A0AA41Z413_9HYPH|nr:hypothetical protein [Lichenifustis flavocetrariae]MCW6512611.1 hypothetical protein [Lichenifustis flavocetrariae]